MKIDQIPSQLLPLSFLRRTVIGTLVLAFIAISVICEIHAQEDQPKPNDATEATAKPDPEAVENGTAKEEISPFFRNRGIEDPDEYVIRPGDTVELKIFDEAALDIKQVIDEAGRVDLQLVGRLRIGGMPLKSAQELIRKKYDEEFLIDPVVNLTVLEKAKRRFVILGQIRNPGYYEVPRSLKLDVLQAIALAGGYTRIAGTVTLKRTTKNGEEKKKYSIRKLKRMPLGELPKVYEEDTIIVSESFF